ncbi:NTP transferase domain-containing protein [Micromonospora sp. CPCC 205371]|nr:NTP transferase domain-containing protein [Micromonospora sp. CPCC 205371]
MDALCAVVLAAGQGTRLRPLTEYRPKALCPVGNVPLLDRALGHVAALGLTGSSSVAVNACYLGEQIVEHVGDRVHVSVELGDPLGTAGGIGKLRDWIGGRGVLVGNADAYLTGDIAPLLSGWDGESVRLLGRWAPDEPYGFSGHQFAGYSLLPWRYVRDLRPEPGELVKAVWRPAEAAGELTVATYRGTFLDTGTPRDYLSANLDAASFRNLFANGARVTGTCDQAVIGEGAVVEGRVTRAVVWPGAHVAPDEHLVDAIRAPHDVTVLASPTPLPVDQP